MADLTNLEVQCCRCRHTHHESDRVSRPRPRRSTSEIQIYDMVCPRCGAKNYYDVTPWAAWCWASGLIELGETPPAPNPDGSGAIVIARGPKSWLVAVIQAVARHGYGASAGKLLMPGVPEAEFEGENPVMALESFVEWCAKGNGHRHQHGVVFAIESDEGPQ